MALTEGEGVSCAAVLLVRLALPLPVLHPGKREGYGIIYVVLQILRVKFSNSNIWNIVGNLFVVSTP